MADDAASGMGLVDRGDSRLTFGVELWLRRLRMGSMTLASSPPVCRIEDEGARDVVEHRPFCKRRAEAMLVEIKRPQAISLRGRIGE